MRDRMVDFESSFDSKFRRLLLALKVLVTVIVGGALIAIPLILTHHYHAAVYVGVAVGVIYLLSMLAMVWMVIGSIR